MKTSDKPIQILNVTSTISQLQRHQLRPPIYQVRQTKSMCAKIHQARQPKHKIHQTKTKYAKRKHARQAKHKVRRKKHQICQKNTNYTKKNNKKANQKQYS